MTGERGESPGYPLVDNPEDGGVEERAWVPTDWAATADDAVAWFRGQWPQAVVYLEEEGRELVATGTSSWHRQGPCLVCGGAGAGPRPRAGESWLDPLAIGPPAACEACGGNGQQAEDRDYVAWEPCSAQDAGAVEFWDLEARP